MPVQLNHTIVWCRDNAASSAFLAGMLGLPPPRPVHHFMVVELDNGVSLDFLSKDGAIARQHYAFLIGEPDFEAVFARIEAKGMDYWADPAKARPGQISHNDGGRGFYFDDPDGHLLEVLTRPYGGG